jgi:predicted transcriptional regulator
MPSVLPRPRWALTPEPLARPRRSQSQRYRDATSHATISPLPDPACPLKEDFAAFRRQSQAKPSAVSFCCTFRRLHRPPISRVLSWATIPLGPPLPTASSSLPGSDASHAITPLFGLAPNEVCHAVRVTTSAVSSYLKVACAALTHLAASLSRRNKPRDEERKMLKELAFVIVEHAQSAWLIKRQYYCLSTVKPKAYHRAPIKAFISSAHSSSLKASRLQST